MGDALWSRRCSSIFIYKDNMKLLQASLNTQVKFLSVENGSSLMTKLNQYGLYQGDSMRVLRAAPLGGPLLVQVNGREIALGREIADKIIVE